MAKKLQKHPLHTISKTADLPISGHRVPLVLGYARVSTDEQDLAVQMAALEKLGCAKIYKEKISSADAKRPELRLLRKQAEPGDTIYVHAFSRLARDLILSEQIIKDFQDRDITLKSITEPHIDLTTEHGRMMAGITAVLNRFERDQARSRTKRAMAQKKAEGMYIGRPVKVTPEVRKKVKAMRKEGKSAKFIAAKLKISTSAVYGVK